MTAARRDIAKLLAAAAGGLAVGQLTRLPQLLAQSQGVTISEYYRLPASVIVFRDGDYAVAIDDRGRVIARSTDHANVIQSAIGDLGSDGGRIFIMRGKYYISSKIVPENKIIIEGEGRGTELIASSDINIIECIGSSSSLKYGIVIRNLKLHGNNVGKSGIYLKYVAYSGLSRIENVIVDSFTNFGIRLEDCYGIDVIALIQNCSQYGLGAWRCNGSRFALKLYNNNYSAYFFACTRINISGLSEQGGAIKISDDGTYPGGDITIENMYFEGNSRDIQVTSFVDSLKNVVVRECYFQANPDYHIIISGYVDGVTIEKNRFLDAQTNCIAILGSNVKNVYVKQNYYQTATPFIYDESNAVKLYDNINYRSKASGTSTISAGSTSVTVSHGLVSTPSKINVTPLGDPGSRWWVDNVTDTSFDIVLASAPTADVTFYWEAEV